jgi:hypothetical protein
MMRRRVAASGAGAIDLSDFYAAAFNPLPDYVRKQNAWIGKILAESAAVRMRPVLPRIVLDSPLIRMNAVTENLRRQMADLTGFNDMRFQQGAHRLRPGHPHERYSLVDQELFQVIQVWRDVAQVLRVEPVDDVAEGGEDAVPLGRPAGRAQRLQGLAEHVVRIRRKPHSAISCLSAGR